MFQLENWWKTIRHLFIMFKVFISFWKFILAYSDKVYLSPDVHKSTSLAKRGREKAIIYSRVLLRCTESTLLHKPFWWPTCFFFMHSSERVCENKSEQTKTFLTFLTTQEEEVSILLIRVVHTCTQNKNCCHMGQAGKKRWQFERNQINSVDVHPCSHNTRLPWSVSSKWLSVKGWQV